jgi:prepilin-type N-terminal cleavage/methylation domain-containing protein
MKFTTRYAPADSESSGLLGMTHTRRDVGIRLNDDSMVGSGEYGHVPSKQASFFSHPTNERRGGHSRKTMVVGRSGFTLMEIMVVVLIIGLLAAFAVPSFRMARRKTQALLIQNNLKQIMNAAELYFIEHGVSNVSIDHLVSYNEPGNTVLAGAGTGGNTNYESYTNPIKCIRGEIYSKIIAPEKSATTTTVGTIHDSATFVAVPISTGNGDYEYIGTDLLTGKAFSYASTAAFAGSGAPGYGLTITFN